MALSTEKIIERVAKAPVGIKVGVVAALVAVVTALNYFVVGVPRVGPSIMEAEAKIAKLQAEQRKLDGDLMEKTAIANNLNQFRREKEQLEQRLQEALAELPNEKQIDELLQLFQDRAQKAGLEILTVEPKAPEPQGFYARLPIPMSVSGSYHEIATFFDAIGRFRRIVNVSGITMDTPKDTNGRIVVNAKFLATAFMFIDAAAQPAADPNAAKKTGSGK